MNFYNKIYEIIDKKYIPTMPINNNLEDMCCYYFYRNNIYFHQNNQFDLHQIVGIYINEIMDSIYDYCMNNYIKNINIITGNGKVLKPIVKKYLDFYNMKYTMENKGNFCVDIY